MFEIRTFGNPHGPSTMRFVSGLENNKILRPLCLPFSFYYWVDPRGGRGLPWQSTSLFEE